MKRACLRCNVDLERGSLRASGMGAAPGGVVALSMGEFRFTLAGTPTSWNPIEAFKQGLADEPEDRNMPVVIWRCPKCGMLELAAVEG